MNLLFAIDDRFSEQLKTTLYSIKRHTTAASFDVYVLQEKELSHAAELEAFCQKLAMAYHPIIIGSGSIFKTAPVSDRYPESIYYRLLAQNYLPQQVEKILYLDADILCINDLRPLYELTLGDFLYAAASHSKLTEVTTVINKVRLRNYESEGYYNSGVLLMNVHQLRQEVKEAEIAAFIEKNHLNLFLPDQDILNGLYGDRVLAIPDQLYNYDVRKNRTYETISLGEWSLDWVIEHTVLLHFCGKEKPWKKGYRSRYGALYKYVENERRKFEEGRSSQSEKHQRL
ncbi:glycosyltransferase family 8 protein [Enterococcus casseliflavus]|uniref:Glycosyltransferase family 8 protein n=1 Tax=Enterococcus casseliflavus TaxID=37734 RepID=A0AAW8UPI5_ENTCA|nr:glycosyltransferase family 8 protein [Enterococcus casseliflavus]MDT2963676.1 glycosyltransferase family 8 protein [Enterococcus casseliflavus]